MIGRLFANLSFTSMYRMSVISATNVYFCREADEHTHSILCLKENVYEYILCVCEKKHAQCSAAVRCIRSPLKRRHLSMPEGVGGVGDDGRSPLLSVMAEDWEDAPLPRVNGHLQVRVRIEKHSLFQAGGTQICGKASVTASL